MQRWFRPWRRRGYTLAWGSGGHRLVHDPDGALVTTMSSTPRDLKAALANTERVMRRHDEARRAGDQDEEARRG